MCALLLAFKLALTIRLALGPSKLGGVGATLSVSPQIESAGEEARELCELPAGWLARLEEEEACESGDAADAGDSGDSGDAGDIGEAVGELLLDGESLRLCCSCC